MKHPTSSHLTTAAQACRVPIFSPARKVGRRLIQQRVESSWGHAVITGRLGQRERDVLDLACSLAERWRTESTGDVTALVDSARLRAALGWDRWKYAQIRDALRELRTAEIELVVHGGRAEWCGILTHIVESGEPPPRRVGSRGRWRGTPTHPEPGRTTPRDGMYWEITISRAWIELLRRLPSKYPIEVTRMRFGVSQAVARMMLSHQQGAVMQIATVLLAVGVASRDRARARRELAADGPKLAAVGVLIDHATGMVVTRTAPETGRLWPNLTRTAPETTRTAPETTRTAPEKRAQPRSL